jgi:hypothetical protein
MKNSLLLAFFGRGDDRLFQWDSSPVMTYEGSYRLSDLILQVLAYRKPILLLVIIQHMAQILQPFVSCFSVGLKCVVMYQRICLEGYKHF